jgi:hypothetical protein
MTRFPYSLLATAAAGTLALGACNPFRSPLKQAPVVQVSTRDANANARWTGTLASPANLVGAVQMKGSAAMTPGSNGGSTHVSVELSNASPGGVHPWQLRHGQCGQDSGPFGMSDAYKSLTVSPEGRASSSVTVPLVMPTEGRYYVSVSASAANPETIVACGNLAAPSR